MSYSMSIKSGILTFALPAQEGICNTEELPGTSQNYPFPRWTEKLLSLWWLWKGGAGSTFRFVRRTRIRDCMRAGDAPVHAVSSLSSCHGHETDLIMSIRSPQVYFSFLSIVWSHPTKNSFYMIQPKMCGFDYMRVLSWKQRSCGGGGSADGVKYFY